MVSSKNIKYKAQQDAKRVPHYGIRKLSVGVASVLLGTVVYMQNGSTVHADVNPTVSAGNDSVKVADENVGVGYSAGASRGINPADSASSAVVAGGATDSMDSDQPAVSSAERITGQGNNAAVGSGESGSVALTDQVKASANPVVASDNIKVGSGSAVVPNRPASVAAENPSKERWFTNLQVKPSALAVSKVALTGASNNVTNGGFDQSTWGTLDVSKWTGQEENGVYELTGYTGDLEHIIVPNSADFAKAGRNVGQVGISADTTHSWFEKGSPKSIAFSKTDGQMVKAVGSDWTSAFTGRYDRNGRRSRYAHVLTLFDGNNLDVSNVTNMCYMFSDNKLTDLSGVLKWKTDNVMNMSYMFEGNQISDLATLSNWKTDNVMNMSYMFEGNQISDLASLANWKTDNVTNMSATFFGNRISNLMPLVNWKTNNVRNMFNMFGWNQISDLTALASWKTDNVKNMASMFHDNQISDLAALASWKTDNVTDMGGMFSNNRISDLVPLTNWKTDNVTAMYNMFGNNQISSLAPLTNWRTDNVTNMGSMFNDNQISDLAPLTNWKTENVTNMFSMFGDNQISNLAPLANWKTDNVTDMSYMFTSNQISDLSPLTNWKTENVTNMSSMFIDNQVKYADFTKWNFGNALLNQFIYQSVPAIIVVKNSNQVLLSDDWLIHTKQNQLHFGADTVDMPTIYAASDKADARQKILADIKTKLADYQKSHADSDIEPVKPLDQLTELVDLANAKFTVKHVLPELDTNDAFALDPVNGLHEHKNVNDNGGYDADFWGTLDVSKFTTVKNDDNLEITGYTGDASKVIIPNIADFWANGLDQGAKQVTISSSVMHKLAKNATRIGLSKTNNQKVVASDAIWQDAFGGLTNSPQTGDNADGGMWVYNPNLTAMDLHNLDTTNVTDMSAMFNGGRNLNVVGDLSQWNTANVASMRNMFQKAMSLTNIGNLNNWDTAKVTDMSFMFNLASKLINIGDLSKWDVSNVTDMNYMFSHAFVLSNIGDLAKWNVANVTSMKAIFNQASALTNIGNLDNWNTAKVTDMSFMFNQASKLTNIGDLSKWDVANVTDMKAMFELASSLTNIGNLDNWNTAKVTDMSFMFNQASKLTNIGDLSKWNVANVTDMKAMFESALSLTNIGNLDNWNTAKVTDMSFMFNQAFKLTNIGDLSKWDVANVTNMNAMFQAASLLTNIGDLSKWNTSKVTDMRRMFNQASALTNIGDLSDWDVANVTNMFAMFQAAASLTNIGNLDNWNTAKVTDMSFMFNQASKLTNIGDLSKWDVANVTNMNDMFQAAASLTNIGNLDNWNTAKVTDMSFMFNQASKLTNIGDLSKWNVANVTYMNAMFQSASSLTNIGNLDNWNTAKVTDMSFMFNRAFKLTNIGDLSKWDTSHVINMSNMFVSVKALRRLNISNWNLTKLANKDSMGYMFANDINRTYLTVIANDVKLPAWYQNEINDADYFWNNHMAVITNVPELIRATGDIDNLKIDDQDTSRSIFYDSKGSSDAIQVLKDANQAYVKQYQNEHPGYTLNLAADVDQTDPLALANASFVSVPREVQFTIAYYDLTGKRVDSTTSTHKVGETVSIAPVAPANYVLVSGQSKATYVMQWGLNEADFLVEPKLTQTAETKTVSRTIQVQTPDGRTKNIVQTVKFVRNGYLNQVTKETTYTPWSFGGQYQFSSYQPKPIDGYTAEVAPGVIVTPDSSDTMLSLTYHKQAAVYSVDYQLANGTAVKNVSVTPESNGMVHLTAPQGYRLLTPVTDMQVGHSSQKLVVLVVPAEQTYTTKDTLPSGVKEPLTKTVTRTVKITMSNGHVRTVKQMVRFERTATVKVDGTVVYGNWNSIGRVQFNKVFIAKRHGYHLVITDASGKTLPGVDKIDNVTAAMSDEVVNVKYVKD